MKTGGGGVEFSPGANFIRWGSGPPLLQRESKQSGFGHLRENRDMRENEALKEGGAGGSSMGEVARGD